MNRRDFLKTTGCAAALLTCRAALAKTQNRPNLLIIHTDEHNFRTLGCYRDTLSEDRAFVWGKQAVVTTPNIDFLAENGALCTKFYATSPVCSPSRAAFVSGRYPQNTPTTGNNVPLDDNVITFAETLRRQGYATGYAGKWHLDGTGKPQWAPQRQFGFADNRYMYNRGHWKQLEDTAAGPRVKALKNGKPTYDVQGADEKSFTTDWLADKTVDFISAHKNEPFCYMVSIPDPHGPNTVRPPYDTMFADMTFDTPKTFNKPDDNVPAWGPKQKKNFSGAYLQKYFAMVKCIDDNVGKILAALRKNRLMDNTIVIFTADHGDLCGEHARDNKGVPYEASAKVPFILYYPKMVKAGTMIDQALGCVDFLPTIISMMGKKAPGTEQGRDASKLFTTGKAPAGWDDIVFIRESSTNKEGWVAAVTGRYKLVFSQNEDPWLFDLEKDPDEITNFLHDPDYRETVRTLARKLRQYGQKYNDSYTQGPKAKADIQWAAGPEEKYVAAVSPAGNSPKSGTNKKSQKTGKTKRNRTPKRQSTKQKQRTI